MKELATKMNAHPLNLMSFIDEIMQSESFEHCIKLTHDDKDMMQWAKNLASSDENEITECCHEILRMLLSYLETTIFGGKKSSSFEKAVLDYYLSDDFKELILYGLPDNLTNN